MTYSVLDYLRRDRMRQMAEEGHEVANGDEAEFLHQLLQTGVPAPITQFRLGPYRLDFAYPAIRVALELDGPWHLTVAGRRRDRDRDRTLKSWGWTTIRIRLDEEWDVEWLAAALRGHANLCRHEWQQVEADWRARRAAARAADSESEESAL